ncbi:MAG: TonB-dependent receptor plug domain-containing protein [Alphaproteobacteria bacterium]
MTIHLKRPLLAAMAGLILISGTASAQTDKTNAKSSEAKRAFEPAYFTQYAPRTALDMIGRIPGFQLDGGDSKRGLGQGGANVLINGQRLSGKADDPFDQVGRIAAKNVVKIEIVDGNSLNIPGLSGQVANVTTKSTGMTGTWEWRPEWREGLEPNLFAGEATISGEKGNLAYTAKIQNDSQRNGHWGPEKRSTAAGDLFEIRDEFGRYNGDRPGGSLSLKWTPDEERVGNLNFEYNVSNFNEQTRSTLTKKGPNGKDGQHLFTFAEDEWNAKIDGDYEFPLADGKLKLIGYYRAEHSPTVSRFDVYDATTHRVSDRFFQVADEGEAIARSEYSWSAKEGRDWQIGVEGAFNFLDIENQFIDLLTPANSGNVDTSRVEEKRAEATLTHTRTLSPKWDTQVSVGGEYSQLAQGALQRDFFRPKGFISATYKPEDNFNIVTKIERDVGQLNFFDFTSSVDLQNNQGTTGNPNLVPSQSWVGEVEFSKQWTAGHSFKARVYGQKISDLVDRIPIGLTGDAVGNIDSAELYGVDFNATVKGDPYGLKGVELELELDFRNSSVEDPVEGFSRRLNGDKKSYWSVSFRHDIPNSDWAYGFFADQYNEAPVYRLHSINTFQFDGPFGLAFIEHKDIFGLKVRADIRNLFDGSDDFKREVYTGRRDQGTLDFIEDRTRPFGYFFRLNISGTF